MLHSRSARWYNCSHVVQIHRHEDLTQGPQDLTLGLLLRFHRPYMNKFFIQSSADLTWIIFFCPLLETFAHFSNILPSWGPRLQVTQTVVNFAQFQVQARKRGVLGGVGGVLCMYISPKGTGYGSVKNRGWGWYSRQNETPSGHNETHLGNLYEKWANGSSATWVLGHLTLGPQDCNPVLQSRSSRYKCCHLDLVATLCCRWLGCY